MVKSDKPLQIRLTEPVIFLRGPSTGLDFRGRPQAVRQDAQPAMLRGLLTLRLAKPTRIRSISIKLEGKARTEWPEGIGPRRMDTHEDHSIISESIDFYSSNDMQTRSQSARRAASLGPGNALYDREEEVLGDDHDVQGDEDEGYPPPRAPPRSASALPGTHDGVSWRRDGFSRRNSVEEEQGRLGLGVAGLSIRDRGPSPAYTPRAEYAESSRRSSLRQTTIPYSDLLSPIHSAAASRATSDRTDSTSTERRFRPSISGPSPLSEDVINGNDSSLQLGEGQQYEPQGQPSRSILAGAGHRHDSTTSNLRFAEETREHEAITSSVPLDSPEDLSETPPQLNGRSASIRTTGSAHSGSSGSVHASSQDHSGGEVHPISSDIHPTSGRSTRVNTPAPSIRGRPSSETLQEDAVPPISGASSRRSSLLRQPGTASPAPSIHSSDSEVRQGRKSRNGNASTIVTDNSIASAPSRPSISGPSSRMPSDSSQSLQQRSTSTQYRIPSTSETIDDGRGRKHSKFSLSAALRGLSKARVSSKSRTRAESKPPSRASSFSESLPPLPDGMSRTNSGTALPPRLLSDGLPPRNRTRTPSFGQADFVPPHGRGGAARVNTSRERNASPSRERGSTSRDASPRGRGRNKGMKVLTGAFGLHPDQDPHTHNNPNSSNTDDHNWKEFRKGTYNYPISFPIPVDAPPTIHAEFGTVVYKLKATVKRVGALTTNLVEEMEVSMIASPQEDDLEETENVIVERQWEEQMRYQIALSGKAFPIGGTIPISIRLMPLMKCKVHRVSVALDEKTDYYAHGRKIARHETPRKFLLLFIKQPEKLERIQPLLPILSDEVDAARNSPLAPLAIQAAPNNPRPLDEFPLEQDQGNDDWMYASLMDPMGPWHLEKSLVVPDCASGIRFTTKHDKTNISVGHFLKVTIRVERGDDEAVDAKGRRKQFDIIIETPIKILDCRVNPQWNSLPTYAAVKPNGLTLPTGICSIHGGPRANLPPLVRPPPTSTISNNPDSTTTPPQRLSALPPDVRDHSTSRSRDRRISEIGVGGIGVGAPNTGEAAGDSLLERNIVFDRLVSGQETEMGEVPPSYVQAVAASSRGEGSQSRSRSRVGREGGRDGAERGSREGRSRSRVGQLREELV